MGRRSLLSGKVCRARHSHRRELHRLLDDALSTPFHKHGGVFRDDRSLTVAAPNGAARVSKRYPGPRAFVASFSRYGTSMMGACQNAAFCPPGSRTVTWQSYLPGCSLLRERLNLSGAVFNLLSMDSVTAR